MIADNARVSQYNEPVDALDRIANKCRCLSYLCFGVSAGLERNCAMNEREWDGFGLLFEDLAADMADMQKKLEKNK